MAYPLNRVFHNITLIMPFCTHEYIHQADIYRECVSVCLCMYKLIRVNTIWPNDKILCTAHKRFPFDWKWTLMLSSETKLDGNGAYFFIYVIFFTTFACYCSQSFLFMSRRDWMCVSVSVRTSIAQIYNNHTVKIWQRFFSRPFNLRSYSDI